MRLHWSVHHAPHLCHGALGLRDFKKQKTNCLSVTWHLIFSFYRFLHMEVCILVNQLHFDIQKHSNSTEDSLVSVDCQYQHLARTGKDGNLICTQVYAGWRRSWTLNTTSTRKHGRLAKQESKVKEMLLSPKLAASHNVADIYTVSDIWHLALFRPQPSQVSKLFLFRGYSRAQVSLPRPEPYLIHSWWPLLDTAREDTKRH